MWKVNLYVAILFIVALIIGVFHYPMEPPSGKFWLVLLLYWFFSCFYDHLRNRKRAENVSIDYGMSFSSSFVLFAGPFGYLILELIDRFTLFAWQRYSKKKEPERLLDTFYNIGSFVIFHTVAFYLFHLLSPVFENLPFGFLLLMFIIVVAIGLQSDILIITFIYLSGAANRGKQIVEHIKNRSFLDLGKTALTNSFLLVFLLEEQWEFLLGLFVLNYMVSRSFLLKAENIQNERDRDLYREMAFTDALTGISNRTWMNKIMADLNEKKEVLCVVVADIDKFKRINDTYNHTVGDIVIIDFSALLKEFMDKADYLFRSGGEEFTLILRGKTYEECVETIQQMMKRLNDNMVEIEHKEEVHSLSYTSSFGLYYGQVDGKLTMEKVYELADDLLLEAKEAGRNYLISKNGMERPFV